MNRTSPELDALWEHIARYADGTLDAHEVEQLESQLKNDSAVLEQFVLYMELHARLTWETRARAHGGEHDPSIHPASFPVRVLELIRRPTPFSLTSAALVIGLMITAMAFMVPPFYRTLTNKADQPATDSYQIVAELQGLHLAKWTDPNASVHRGAFLVRGRALQLDEGVIELTYRDGTSVLLEGPCDYVVEDLGRGTLHRGRLLARVPEAAIGFQVATPTATITDLGTEFGIEVDANGAAEVVVGTGKVQCAANDGGTLLTLSQGQGATVDHQGIIKHHRQADDQMLVAMQNRRETIRRRNDARRIVDVSIHDVSSELLRPFDRRATHLIDGSGLSGRTHSPIPDGNMWETRGTIEEPHDPLPAHVTFDLGDRYELMGMHVWNYNEATHGLHRVGAREVQISVSPTDDPADFVALSTATGNFEFTQADGTATYPGFEVALAKAANADALTQVRLVRFTILSNHGGVKELTGLSEVQFRGNKLEPKEPRNP